MSSVLPPPSSRPRLPIGVSDFRELREAGLQYVDKTDFVAGVVEATDKVLLFPRPRRFGKTLSLSALRCFIEKTPEDARPLFAGLAVAQRPEAWAHFQRYPVIFMTFKDIKASSFALALPAIQKEIARAYEDHRYLLDSGVLDEQQREDFLRILGKTGDDALYWRALRDLSAHLHKHHGEKVAILIDEYDTAIHAGYSAGYYDAVIQFFRNFLSGGLKDNPHLWKGVLTGILRVARGSIFSGLNNLSVYSVLRPAFSGAFGFTPTEVARLAEVTGRAAALPDMERWYNGYRFGDQVIYNPWSVLNFLAGEDQALQSYWVSTSSLDLIRDLLLSHAGDEEGEIEALIRGALAEVRLKVPNREVRDAYRGVFRTWLSQALGDGRRVQHLARALLAGDAETAEALLQDLVLNALSAHDTGPRPGAPERVYHAFVLGLLVHLGPRYRVWSNRESGYGRCDVMILPKTPGEPGAVLELKAVATRRGETMRKAMNAAFRQLRERDYAAELRASGASAVREIGVVFERKKVKVAVANR